MATFTKWFVLGLVLTAGAAASASTRREACRDYSQLDSSLKNLEGIPPTAPVGEMKQAEKQVAMSFVRFEKAAEPFAGPQLGNLKSSIKELEQTTQHIPPNATPAQAHTMIKGEVTKVQVAKNGVLETLGCAVAH